MSEKEPLLPGREIQRTWRHYTIFIIDALVVVCWVIQYFTISEWTQSTIRENLIGNETLDTNISACSDTNKSDPDYLSYTRVEQETAKWQLYYITFPSTTAFISMLILPSYSDFLGRRFLITLSVSATFLRWLALLAVVYFKLHFIYVVIALSVEGMFGTFYGVFAALYSIAADVTSTQAQRTIWITVIDGILSISITVSGLGVGIFIDNCGYVFPILTGCVLCFFTLILAAFVLPETVSKGSKKKPSSPFETVRRIADFYTSNEFKGKRFAYIVLLLAFFFSTMSNNIRTSIETVYQLGKPFCWTSDFIGYFTALRHAGQAFIGVGSIRLLQACLSREVIAVFSNITCAASYVLEALASTNLMMFMVPVVCVFSILAVPLIRSIMSYMTSPDRQGALFAGIAVFDISGAIISTLIGNSIYAATVDFMQGFVFLVLAGMNTIAVLFIGIFMVSKRVKPLEPVN